MIYAGRADMYGDWLNFQSDCKKQREKKVRLAAQARQQTIKLLKQFITVIGIAIAVIPVLIYAIIFMVKK